MSRDPFRNYDAWLEAPFQEEGERLAEAWETYCDEEDVDPDDQSAYQDWLASLYDRDEDSHEWRTYTIRLIQEVTGE